MAEPSPETLRSRYEPRLRAELAELQEASAATSGDRRPVALDQQSVGRLSRMDALIGQAMAAGVDTRRHARIRAIEAALVRLAEDEFGFCTSCGDFIGERRLDLDPTIARCVECVSS